jgi:dTDP-4-dehydrorhamnose 3,5-epimerase
VKSLQTSLSDVRLVQFGSTGDHRGVFRRLFCQRSLASVLGGRQILQINHSCTTEVGAVRGMHFQYGRAAEMKLVRCLRGRVLDVAVDLRAGSPTFLRWAAVELAAETAEMVVIPEGFAHGFQVLEPNSELLYLHTQFYAADSEGGVRHDDPRLGIVWPLSVTDLSARDRSHALLPEDFKGLII